jgi:hypothetical protein
MLLFTELHRGCFRELLLSQGCSAEVLPGIIIIGNVTVTVTVTVTVMVTEYLF